MTGKLFAIREANVASVKTGVNLKSSFKKTKKT
ncbi:MAG: hypothetical protein JWR02_61 [Mucilaginibacter sp.]|nr:hypothetical protein [Mucilaginibacter sp.]